MTLAPLSDHDWWRQAVVYQVYPRSFADGNGDGIGDLAGLRSKLSYLGDLGIDAIWISPWYPSPMKDAGYDVSDYRDIEPAFGTLAEAEAMVDEAHALGLRVLIDIVPNHCSDQHPWFRAALSAAPGSPERDRFVFRDGRGPGGDEPPNDWTSQFGGPAWTRTSGADRQWYLRIYTPEQPDFNWNHPEVRADFEQTLRFWFDRGIDGFRIDVAHGLIKADGLPDVGELRWPIPATADDSVDHPHWDRPEVHAIYRSWRAIGNTYDPPRVFVAEAWVSRPDRLARYVRPDELNTAFNFDYLVSPWRAANLRATIDRTLLAHRSVGAPATWVLENHDVARSVSRFARAQPDHRLRRVEDLLRIDAEHGRPADFALGTRRARAAILLMLALPGGAYLYQGQELGLPEVEDLPDEVIQDPRFEQSGRASRGRDGCRVPLPWSDRRPPYGFSPPDASAPPWLPQPADWAGLSVHAQTGNTGSMLELCRRALAVRRTVAALGEGELTWRAAPDGALIFERTPDFVCLVNVSAAALSLPDGARVLLRSADLDGTSVPADTAVWLAT